MSGVAVTLFTVLHLSSLCLARIPFFQASSPSSAPFAASSPLWPPKAAPAPTIAPQFSPISQPPASPGFAANPPHPRPKHHKRAPPHANSPFPPPQGEITNNRHEMDEFVPQRITAYTSQYDTHRGEMTVRETLAFSARCQGAGICYDMITELSRREMNARIRSDPDIDVFMKSWERRKS